MKNFSKKKIGLLAAIALLLLVSVGGTLAYLFTSTDTLQNIFNPTQVSCAVVEDQSTEPIIAGTVNVSQKSNVKIKSTSNTDAYIRVALVVTWKNDKGQVWAEAPESTDYSMELNLSNGWIKGNDGFYYYKDPVAPGKLTTPLIKEAAQLKVGPVGTDGSQYYLSIEIVASAIQAEGMGATSAQDAWAKAIAK